MGLTKGHVIVVAAVVQAWDSMSGQGGVLGQRREQRLDLGQAIAERLQLVQLEIEQAVTPEEAIALGVEDVAEQPRPGAGRRFRPDPASPPR